MALIVLYGPLAILGGGAEDPTPFLGGWHWQALMFALWDAFVCLSMCIGLLYLFQDRLNRQGRIAHELSRSAYAAYLIHEPVITFPAVLAAGLWISSVDKVHPGMCCSYPCMLRAWKSASEIATI